MRCKYCNARLASHDIWCVQCGRHTDVTKSELSSLQVFKEVWVNSKNERNTLIPIACVAALAGFIPIILLILLFRSISFNLLESDSLSLIIELLIKAIVYSLFIPFLMFGWSKLRLNGNQVTFKAQIKESLKDYPRLYILSLISSAYFAAIYIICYGLPAFGSDPILKLVWLVLVNYWMAVFITAPWLTLRYGYSPIKSIIISYKHFHDVRWNLYLLSLILMSLNLIGAMLAIIGLLVSLPIMWLSVSRYVDKLVEFELLSYRR